MRLDEAEPEVGQEVREHVVNDVELHLAKHDGPEAQESGSAPGVEETMPGSEATPGGFDGGVAGVTAI